ncbi:HEPN-associated N-terminal domain-containing protein [Flavobacterium humi]|uniref:RES domain-containing protein n=1 Tax=Flavobacterium humi TaxID=2562683 RepID=A0A4Z0LBX3_9FLAO|nr:HEPN-associated N-terminal domain-containing protein [Flavobacterium humi]TGD59389.1 RES domain-containing protein [Flavobacterium humi]
MSGAMEEAMRLEELGLNTVPDTNVCAKHIDEPVIRNFIRRNASRGYCDYCEKTISVVPLEDLMEFIMEAVVRLYTDPANFMSYQSSEGGYLGNVYDSNEILQEHFELDIPDNKLFNDVFDSLDLNKPWANEMEYYDSPSDIMLYSWNYFKKVVKHRSRYFFGLVKDFNSDDYRIDSDDMLDEIGDSIKKFGLSKVLPQGTPLYRCRQHKKDDISVNTAEGMTSPPEKYAINPNRMSPAGISMFYGAFELETCLLETLDLKDTELDYFTTVTFISKRELNIIDLSSLPNLPSPFDQKKQKDRFRIVFMKDFVRDLVAPIERDGQVHIEYVPTQIITEYFRFPFSDKLKKEKRIDGIIYPSSKNGKKACVLFFDNMESFTILDMDSTSLKTSKLVYA